MSTKPAVKIGGERVSVDPQLLFQRLLHIAGGDLSKLEEIFKHELTALPSSLFDDSGFLRGSSKQLLAKHLWDASEGCKQQMLRTEDAHYILDGGSLIHQLSWLRGTSYKHLAERYVRVCEEIIPSCDSRLWWVFWGPFHQRHGPCSKKHPARPWRAVYSWHVALGEKGGVPFQYHQQTAVHSSCWKMLGGEWYSGAAYSGGCWLCHSSGGTSVCHEIRYSSCWGRYRPTHSSPFSCQVRHEGCVLLLNQGKCNKMLGDQKNAELSPSQCVQEYLICACIWWLRHHFSAFRCRKICPCEETATKEQTVWKWCQGFPAD